MTFQTSAFWREVCCVSSRSGRKPLEGARVALSKLGRGRAVSSLSLCSCSSPSGKTLPGLPWAELGF